MKTRRVAIIGMDGIYPTCKDTEVFKEKIFSNQSLLRSWDIVEKYGSRIRSKVAGYIKPEENGLKEVLAEGLKDYPEYYEDTLERIPKSNLATADIGSIWAMLSTQNVLNQTGWNKNEVQSEKTGVIVGSGGSSSKISTGAMLNFYNSNKKTRFLGPHAIDRSMTYREAANISCLIKNKGIVESIGSACATGLGNIGYAARLISFGIQDRIIAGGTEGTSFGSYLGFDAMMVLSRKFKPQESSRPFDKERNGFVCSFGCGIVALEEYESAKSRGVEILAVIDSYFNNSDGTGNMFAPSYNGQIRLWNGLMKNPSFRKPDVVKAHGTSTPVGDAVELFSIVQVLGDKGYHISAPKSQYGHMLGAAGAVEFITALLMLKEQKVSPCLNSKTLNEDQENIQKADNWKGPLKPFAAYRDLIPQKAFNKEINTIVCLNYGFGGTNSAISISKDIK